MQFAFVLATSERGNKNICEQIGEYGENHGEATKGADLGDGSRTVSKKTDEKDCDLPLETIKDGVGREMLD